MTTFKDLGLNPAIQQALDELGYEDPTPIQEEAIPQLLDGHDVIGQAQTGTGKTAAFGLPLLQYLDPENNEVQAIVMTPTRELCIQVTQALRSMAEHLDIEIVAVFGGAPIRSQQSQLRAGAHVVVATVGRMMDLMNRRSLVLTAARYVVLDEADEMLDLGFIEDVEKILRMCPSGRQTALFSATMPPPIQRLAEGYMYDPVTISITPKTLTVDAIQQAFVEVPAKEKTARLIELLKVEEPEQAIIFCRTKIGATRLERALKDKGLDVKALHGDMSQGSRDGVMIAFKDHRVKLLVATDIAARGLDVEHVTHVINFDVPNSSETYVHRIGRTGRVGRTGRAITFVTPAERDEIGRIERDVNTKIGEWESPEERLEHAPAPRRRERRPRREREEGAEVEAAASTSSEPDKDAEVEADEAKPEREAKPTRRPRRAVRAAEPEANGDGDADADDREADVDGDAAATEADGKKTTKLFVNRGERSGIDEEDLRWALREGAVLPDEAVHDVRVLHRFSFVEVDPDQAERTVEFLDGTKLKGKEIRLEVAKS
ncbi:MAG TPA: DEAD/DEAH box helicase [Solirubrobacterales bacterium]|nr:DEAD/DEAH box helicase [Solirubrobacterales bacterium]